MDSAMSMASGILQTGLGLGLALTECPVKALLNVYSALLLTAEGDPVALGGVVRGVTAAAGLICGAAAREVADGIADPPYNVEDEAIGIGCQVPDKEAVADTTIPTGATTGLRLGTVCGPLPDHCWRTPHPPGGVRGQNYTHDIA